MTEFRRRVVIIEPGGRPRGRWRSLWAWFRRDFFLRRLALIISALCFLYVLGYVLFRVILLAPILLLGVLAFLYGMSGRDRFGR